MATPLISDITSCNPDTCGIFDTLMKSVDIHLDKQYVSGRIKGADYATVYLGALQAVLQQAMQFVVIQEQVAASEASTNMKQAQAANTNTVLVKQAQGFDRDYKYKVAKSMLDIRTTALTQGIEGIASESGDAICKTLLEDAGLPFVANTISSSYSGQFLIDPA